MKRKKAEHASEQSAGTLTGVPEPDQRASGDAGTGRENNDKQDAGQESTPNPRLAERMTGLRGLSIGKGRIAPSTLRKRTEQDLRLPDAEIPYFKTEKAVMDLFCSLLERQDRMNESIFLKLNDLAYRVDDVEYRLDDLEGCLESAGIKRSGTDKEGRK